MNKSKQLTSVHSESLTPYVNTGFPNLQEGKKGQEEIPLTRFGWRLLSSATATSWPRI